MDKLFSLDEFLHNRMLLQSSSNGWTVLIVDLNDIPSIVDDLKDTLEIFIESEIAIISGKKGAKDLDEQIREASQDYLVIFNLELWNEQEWNIFDGFRSSLDQDKKGGFLILCEQSVYLMNRNAPHFVSWASRKFYRLKKDAEMLTQTERDRRLNALQENFEMSDQDVIDLAENRQLPSDPEFGEWLILLDRGDLLERQK